MTEMEYTPGDLRAMDDEEAREELNINQYERREKLLELDAEAEATADRFAEEEETVHGIAVATDPEELGTRVETMGNELLVHLDRENRHVKQHLNALQDLADENDDVPDPEALDEENVDAAVEHVLGLLRAAVVRWNGAEFRTLSETERDDVLARARAGWGADGVLLAFSDILLAVAEERQEREAAMQSFRSAPRDGRGGGPR